MHELADAGRWLDAGSGLLVALIGLAVLLVRPRGAAQVALAVFAVPFGLQFALGNLAVLVVDAPSSAEVPPAIEAARLLCRLIAAGGAVAMAALLPRPLERSERRLLALPVIGAILFAAVRGIAPPAATASSYALWAALGALYGTLAVWTLRATRSEDASSGRSFGLLYGALVVYPGFIAGSGANIGRESWLFGAQGTTSGLAFLACVALAGLWLRHAARGGAARLGVRLALLTLALPLAGVLWVLAGLGSGGVGIARTISVAALAYAILRHQVLGIDVKVRWGISKTTLAAVFIAVFFVASEAAQQFFGETLGSSYVGILAAGALVFAIAPLSRLADRVAEKAVPVATTLPWSDAAPTRVAGGSEEIYRAAVRMAWSDGVFSREDEDTLDQLADELGLPRHRTTALRREVEAVRGRSRA